MAKFLKFIKHELDQPAVPTEFPRPMALQRWRFTDVECPHSKDPLFKLAWKGKQKAILYRCARCKMNFGHQLELDFGLPKERKDVF